MRDSARKLCLFGATVIVLSLIAAYLFEHIPFPWLFPAPPALDDKVLEQVVQDRIWQLHAVLWSLTAGLVGVIFLLGGGVIYLISGLRPAPANSP